MDRKGASGERTRTLSDSVATVHSWVRAAILSGRLAAGQSINQAQLATQLGVSRTPLREALRMLQAENLVVGKLNQKMRVAPLSPPIIDSLCATRILMEGMAIALTVPRLSRNEIAAIESGLAHMNAQVWLKDRAGWEVHHNEFHRMLIMHAGTVAGPVFQETIGALQVRAERYRRLYVSYEPQASVIAIADHTAIVRAVSARNVEGAVLELSKHYARTATVLLKHIAPEFDPVAIRNALAVAGETSRESPIPGRPSTVGMPVTQVEVGNITGIEL